MICLPITMSAPYKVKEGVVTEMPDHEFWVRATDNVHRSADELANDLDAREWIDLACIGAGCVNQGLKIVAVLRERMRTKHRDLVVQPFFSTIEDDGGNIRTRMMMRVTTVVRDV